MNPEVRDAGVPIQFFAIFGLVGGALLLVLVGWRVLRMARIASRKSRWSAVPATVTGVEMTEIRDQWRVRVEYSYEVDGRVYTGRARFHSQPPAAQGDGIVVWVDPAEPGRSLFDDHENSTGYYLTLAFGAIFGALCFFPGLALLLG